MKLYLVLANNYSWDDYIGFVIRAKNETHAREIAAGKDDNWRGTPGIKWMKPEKVSVVALSKVKTPGGGIILDSFHAG